MQLSYFESFTSRQVMETTLEGVVEMIRSSERLLRLTEAYRATGAKSVKSESPLFAVACRFRGGKARANVTDLTGLSLVDVDGVADAVDDLFARACQDGHTLLCYRTISGRGLRIIFRYRPGPETDGAQHGRDWQFRHYARAFEAGNDYYERLLGVRADRQCKNVTRLSGLAHDAGVFFRPTADPLGVPQAPAAEPQTRAPRTARGGWAAVCRRLRTGLDRRERFAEGNHHNYLVRLCLLMADRRVPQDEAVGFLQADFADYRGEDFPRLVDSCYRSAQDSAADGRDARPTKAELIVDFLRTQPLRYDVLSRKIQIRQQPADADPQHAKADPQHTDGADPAPWTDLTDRMANDLLYACNQALGTNVSKNTFLPMLMSAQVPEVHPLREYIRSLPPWDGGEDYIRRVAAMVRVEGDGVLWERCFRKWLCAMVAGWMYDEAVNHQVLVLIGEQGIFKTSWLDALMPPRLAQYRSKQSSAGRMDKDEQLRATEFGLINMDEIDRMSESELNQLKSLITSTDVNVRSPYAYGKERRLRVASYVASGNKDRFLTDQTGNRRWLPFRVTSIDSPFLHPLPYEGLYAQAWALVQGGMPYWFSLEEIRALSDHVEQFAVETNEAQLLPVYFRPCPAGTPDAQFLTVAEISAKLTLYGNIRRPMDIRQLAILLRKMGYEPHRTKNGSRTRGFIVMEMSADQIHANRRLDAR